MIKTYKPGEKEYTNLGTFANLLRTLSPKNFLYDVENVYYDFDADMMWTTVICHIDSNRTFQALNPNMYERICEAESKLDLMDIARDYFNGEYCLDK